MRCKLKGQLYTLGNFPDSFSTNCFNNATSSGEEVGMLGNTGRKQENFSYSLFLIWSPGSLEKSVGTL